MRLILLDVQLKPVDDSEGSPKEAYVVLSLKSQRVVGHYIQTGEQDDLAIVAAATLNAVQQALPVPVKLTLRNAIKLTPQFLDTPLLVVIADLQYGKSRFELTGACQCEESAMKRGVAQAALDATNRLVSFIFAEQNR